MKKNIPALIFGCAIVLASVFLGKAYVDRAKPNGEIRVTGLGKTDFTSDLIVWEGSFTAENKDLKQAYFLLEKYKSTVKAYLVAKGIDPDELIFNAVEIRQRDKTLYSETGKYMGKQFVDYQLKQGVQIESNDVSKIEKMSREVTELINQGVQFYSQSPRYYYTKLSDLKIEMISKATEDAKLRADKIAEFSGGNLGKLVSAKMGIFQITGQNSKEDYSWGGTFNTSSREKTASITMKLVYKTDD
jgi:Uncharacterized protein conserved in bacteria